MTEENKKIVDEFEKYFCLIRKDLEDEDYDFEQVVSFLLEAKDKEKEEALAKMSRDYQRIMTNIWKQIKLLRIFPDYK